jgi:hypothetical protein
MGHHLRCGFRWRPSRCPNTTDPANNNSNQGRGTHEGAGAKAAAPPMRARMARTRIVPRFKVAKEWNTCVRNPRFIFFRRRKAAGSRQTENRWWGVTYEHREQNREQECDPVNLHVSVPENEGGAGRFLSLVTNFGEKGPESDRRRTSPSISARRVVGIRPPSPTPKGRQTLARRRYATHHVFCLGYHADRPAGPGRYNTHASIWYPLLLGGCLEVFLTEKLPEYKIGQDPRNRRKQTDGTLQRSSSS